MSRYSLNFFMYYILTHLSKKKLPDINTTLFISNYNVFEIGL